MPDTFDDEYIQLAINTPLYIEILLDLQREKLPAIRQYESRKNPYVLLSFAEFLKKNDFPYSQWSVISPMDVLSNIIPPLSVRAQNLKRCFFTPYNSIEDMNHIVMRLLPAIVILMACAGFTYLALIPLVFLAIQPTVNLVNALLTFGGAIGYAGIGIHRYCTEESPQEGRNIIYQNREKAPQTAENAFFKSKTLFVETGLSLTIAVANTILSLSCFIEVISVITRTISTILTKTGCYTIDLEPNKQNKGLY